MLTGESAALDLPGCSITGTALPRRDTRVTPLVIRLLSCGSSLVIQILCLTSVLRIVLLYTTISLNLFSCPLPTTHPTKMSELNFKKCYFLAPTRNYTPNKRILLGNIITSPSGPDAPLNRTPFVIDPNEIDIHNEQKWKKQVGKDHDVTVGIWASFMQFIVGIGGDLSVGQSTDITNSLKGDTTTEEFSPALDFVKACIQDQGVQQYLNQHKKKIILGHFSARIYMITGIKIAKDASQVAEAAKHRNIHLHLGVDGTGAGVPGSAGPDLDLKWGNTNNETFEKADTFVLGFRLHEIKIHPKNLEDVKIKQFVDGAKLGKDADKDQLDEVELETDGLETEDARAADFGIEKEKVFVVMDENSGLECECAVTY